MPSICQIAVTLPVFLLPAFSAPSLYPANLFSRQSAPAPTTAEVSYQCFSGTNFPSRWLPWDQLLAVNKPALSRGNSPETVENIISAIKSVSSQATPQILPEFILAMIMQESGGALGHIGDKGKSIGLMQVQLKSEAPHSM